jgi:hypothetical protein
MSTRSDHDYTTLALAHLLHNWRDGQPRFQGSPDHNVTGTVGRVHQTGQELFLLFFSYVVHGCC